MKREKEQEKEQEQEKEKQQNKKNEDKRKSKTKEKSYTPLALLVAPLSFDRGIDTRGRSFARIEGMTKPPSICEKALLLQLSAARAEATHLHARVEQLEAQMLASDEHPATNECNDSIWPVICKGLRNLIASNIS